MLSVKAKCNGKFVAISANTIITIKVEYFWFNLIKKFFTFWHFSFYNLSSRSANFLAESASATQKIKEC